MLSLSAYAHFEPYNLRFFRFDDLLTVHTDLRGFCFPCHQIFKYTPSILKPSSQFNPLSACLQLSCGEIHQAIPGIGCTLWGYKCCGILDFCNFGHDPGVDANHRFFCKPVMDRHDTVVAVAGSLGISDKRLQFIDVFLTNWHRSKRSGPAFVPLFLLLLQSLQHWRMWGCQGIMVYKRGSTPSYS